MRFSKPRAAYRRAEAAETHVHSFEGLRSVLKCPVLEVYEQGPGRRRGSVLAAGTAPDP